MDSSRKRKSEFDEDSCSTISSTSVGSNDIKVKQFRWPPRRKTKHNALEMTTDSIDKIRNILVRRLSPQKSYGSGSSRDSVSSSPAPQKRKRRSSSSLDDKDPELSFEGPSAKRQHLPTTSCQLSSDPSSSVPSSCVYPSPVDEMDNEIESRSSDCVPPSFNLPIPESPNSIGDDLVLSSDSFESFDIISDSECENADATLVDGSQPERLFHYDGMVMTPAEPPSEPRACPLPALSWANAPDVWSAMCRKDENATLLRNPAMLENHPGLQPRMRAILLDWLIEVCEVYKLHRETYYLAVDYLDRYLSSEKHVPKTHLQLIGITCLFIAAKVEEIYPPKIGEFAYVTDGACQEDDIIQYEVIALQALDWSITPVTAMGWLGVYMQLNVNNRTPASLFTRNSSNKIGKEEEGNDTFIFPQFSGLEFVQTAQLLDLCSLDVRFSNFPYSVTAAAAISHTFDKETAIRVSGLNWKTLQPCAKWMESFFQVVSEQSEFLHLVEQTDQVSSKYGMSHWCPNIITDDSHIVQTHAITMAMYDRATLLTDHYAALEKTSKTEASPAIGLKCPDGLLTPPASGRKPPDDENDDENDHNHDHDDHVRGTTSLTSSDKENTQ